MTGILIPYAKLGSIFEGENSSSIWIVAIGPEPSEQNVPLDEPIVVRAIMPDSSPGVTSPSIMSVAVEIDTGSGWQTIYDGATFAAPWDAGSSETESNGSSPYVWKQVNCVPGVDVYPDDSTVQVRVTVTTDGGWGYFEWGGDDEEWGYPEDGATVQDSFSFDTVDETAPTVVSVEAVGRQTIRVTYSEDMSPSTISGKASVASTVLPASWPTASTLPWTFVVELDGVQQTVEIDETMVSGSSVEPNEVSFALSSLLDGVVASDDGSIITLETEDDGDDATLQVTGGTGANYLGFPDSLATGAYKGVLDAENYTVTRHNVYPNPAVNIEIVGAEFETDSNSVVNLETQWAMTPDAPYRMVIDGDVSDVSGNIVDPSTLTHDFQGFLPAWPARRDASIKLPQVIWDHDAEQVMRAIINIWEEFFGNIVSDYDEFWNLLSADEIDTDLLPLALADMGNPFDWSDLELSSAEQRKLLSLLPSIYESKGTAPGIESTIYLLLGIPCSVEPHIEDGWRLGVDILGDSYPASIRSANSETFDLSTSNVLTVVVDQGTPQDLTLAADYFTNPAAATAIEVASAIDELLDGGGAVPSDDGTGARVLVYSSFYGPGGTIQVTGGTANAILGFSTTTISSSGGCRLAPGDSRSLRTFDLVYGDVVPSEEQKVLMRKIADYMRCANEFVGTIRPAKVYEPSDRWIVGQSTLGQNTVIG